MDHLVLAAADKDLGKVLAEDHQHKADQHRVNYAQLRGLEDAVPDPLQLAGTHILSRIGGHGGAQCIINRSTEVSDLLSRRDGGHIDGAQTVHCGLQHHGADGGDGILQSHGKPHLQENPAFLQIRLHFPLLKAERRELMHHVEKAHEARQPLGNAGGIGRSVHPEPQEYDGDIIQKNIEKCRKHQKVYRRPGISQRTNHRGRDIVEEGHRYAQEDDENVFIGIGKDIFRGVHPLQNMTCQQRDHRRHKRRKSDCQPDDVSHVPPHAGIVLGAEALGHRNGKAGAGPDDEAVDHKVHGTGGAHARQGIHAQGSSDNDGIHHAVELLEQSTQQHGNRESQNQCSGASAGHILHRIAFFHYLISPFSRMSPFR